MKLLLDENISWRLVAKLKPFFDDVLHVNFIALKTPLSDNQIWGFAHDNNFVIVTNDYDYINLMNLLGFPPKVILLTTGNQSSQFIFDLMMKKKAEINALQNASEYGILEIY